MDKVQKLYEELRKGDFITMGFDIFKEALKNQSYKKNVFDLVSEQGLFTQDFEAFNSTFTQPDEEQKPVNWFNQTWFGRGYDMASTTGEATDLKSIKKKVLVGQRFIEVLKETLS